MAKGAEDYSDVGEFGLNVQVNVDAPPGPQGLALETKQDTMITALQLIDDLRDALESVGTDNLQVKEQGQANTTTIYNLTLTNADTEYSQALPANTKKYMIGCRTANAMKLAFTSGQSGTTYFTIPANRYYWEDMIDTPSLTIYLQSPTAGVVAEIIAWT